LTVLMAPDARPRMPSEANSLWMTVAACTACFFATTGLALTVSV
jgi:hypothetical protein